jgi:class 3 adenylate cyclase
LATDQVERRLAAILAADIVGSSRLMAEDEEGTLVALRKIWADLFGPAVEKYRGRIVKMLGDGALVEFASAVNAVECAVAVQNAMATRNAAAPDRRPIEFRIGVNLGDIVTEDDDIFGDGVNIASRLEGVAPPGGILISDIVQAQVAGKIAVTFADAGEVTLRGYDKPLHVWRWGAGTSAGIIAKMSTNRLSAKQMAVAIAVILAVASGALAFWLQNRVPAPGQDEAAFPDIARPTRHFKADSADLTSADAITIYDRIKSEMSKAYAQSGLELADGYTSWTRYNAAPYQSATHGNRYVNNYANTIAKDYANLDAVESLPRGSILAKDSFEVTKEGDVLTGPLALMEKMQPGFNPPSRDWRYTMILPDGSVFGITNGEGSDRVEFCIGCHVAAGDDMDHLFYVPERYRAKFLNPE